MFRVFFCTIFLGISQTSRWMCAVCKVLFFFQFIEKLDSGKYKLHSKNHEMHEEYDFLIWAGHPFDLPKLMYPCDMKNYLFDLFKTQESNYVTASFLSMKNSIRGKEFYRRGTDNVFLLLIS